VASKLLVELADAGAATTAKTAAQTRAEAAMNTLRMC
jgi:hypothetical protein